MSKKEVPESKIDTDAVLNEIDTEQYISLNELSKILRDKVLDPLINELPKGPKNDKELLEKALWIIRDAISNTMLITHHADMVNLHNQILDTYDQGLDTIKRNGQEESYIPWTAIRIYFNTVRNPKFNVLADKEKRNELIKEFKDKDMSYGQLHKMTGLSKSTLHEICSKT